MSQINLLRISRFKCFIEDKFDLRDITVLTGGNGAGKSSLIQSLLLARIAVERTSKMDFNEDGSFHAIIPLNGEYNLQLGTIYDVIREKDAKESTFSVTLDSHEFTFGILADQNPANRDDDTALAVSFRTKAKEVQSFLFKDEFYYLNTERLGPRYQITSSSPYTTFVHCGFNGEHTAKAILHVEKDSLYTSAMLERGSSLFTTELNRWLTTICPGVSISVKPLNSLTSQIMIKGGASASPLAATNIGFGISYVLPIIVTGLIAQRGSMLIVENPEAHLHPKAQSNIGFFLGFVASKGVKVLIETHSEHVVNGIRRASILDDSLESANAIIYFFNGFDYDGKLLLQEINILESGSLDKFPLDFFDQLNQDTGEIIKSRLKKK